MPWEVQHMGSRIRQATVGTAFLALICVAGCGGKGTVQGVTETDTSWSSSAANAVPGIDEGSVTFVTLKCGPPEGVSFVVWSDLPNGTGGRGEGSARGAFYQGYHRANDGRRIDFHGKTTDGRTGSINIAGVDYDFAKGTLFLISKQQDPPEVDQISFDPSGLQKVDAVKELAKSNPEIRTFFEKHKKRYTNGK
jgi:hypothetical protein